MNVIENPLLVDLEKCTGCMICETACSSVKGIGPSDARIKVLKVEELEINIPVVRINCDLCGGQPMCAAQCPTGALRFMDLGQALSMRKGIRLQKLFAPIIGAHHHGGL